MTKLFKPRKSEIDWNREYKLPGRRPFILKDLAIYMRAGDVVKILMPPELYSYIA